MRLCRRADGRLGSGDGAKPRPAADTGATPYKPVAITSPQPMTDASFEAMRKQLGEAAQRKDRAAMARLVVAQGFFWQRENRNAADKRKSGFDNLSAALGLANKEGAGWDILSGYAEDPGASPSPEHKGAMCAPADPAFDAKSSPTLSRRRIATRRNGAIRYRPGSRCMRRRKPMAR